MSATRENEGERLAARASAKLAELQAHGSDTDAQAVQRKRAVIDAALARARGKAP